MLPWTLVGLIEEIKRLKHRYFRTLDLKLWEEFGDCLTEDVTARYGTQAMDKPLHYDNRADVVAFMSENLGTGDRHGPRRQPPGDRRRR